MDISSREAAPHDYHSNFTSLWDKIVYRNASVYGENVPYSVG